MIVLAIIFIVLGIIIAILKSPLAFNRDKAVLKFKDKIAINLHKNLKNSNSPGRFYSIPREQIQRGGFLTQRKCRLWVAFGILLVIAGVMILIF